jgi:hypothetical protein
MDSLMIAAKAVMPGHENDRAIDAFPAQVFHQLKTG